MSFLPYRSGEGSKYADSAVGSVPRCAECEKVLDGQAEVEGHDTCTDCRSKASGAARSSSAERQERIEELLDDA
jgi:hypothetical protein